MPVDPESGLYFEWKNDKKGKPYRDFTVRGQVDDRWDIDEHGNIIRVRDKVGGPRIDGRADE